MSHEGGDSGAGPSSGFLVITPVTAASIQEEEEITPVCVKEEEEITPVCVKDEEEITPVCVKEEEEITPVCVKDEGETYPVSTKEEGAAYSTDNQEPERRTYTIGLKRFLAITPVTAASIEEEEEITPVCVKEEEITPVCVKEEEEITPMCAKDEGELYPVSTKEEGAAYSMDNQEPERRKCSIGLKRRGSITRSQHWRSQAREGEPASARRRLGEESRMADQGERQDGDGKPQKEAVADGSKSQEVAGGSMVAAGAVVLSLLLHREMEGLLCPSSWSPADCSWVAVVLSGCILQCLPRRPRPGSVPPEKLPTWTLVALQRLAIRPLKKTTSSDQSLPLHLLLVLKPASL